MIDSKKIDLDIIPSNLLLKKIQDNKELINKYIMGESIVSFIYKFCRAVKIFNYLYGSNYKKIIDFTFGMITDISNFEIDNEFFFKNTHNLKSFLVKLHAASLINMHLIIDGRTGMGKTSAAIYYAKKRGKDNNFFFIHFMLELNQFIFVELHH